MSSARVACCALLAALFARHAAIPVDNGVEGEPNVQCGPQAIEVSFRTRSPFQGRLYVRGLANVGDCANEQIGRTFTGITLPFDACNVQRLRSLNPKGIFASTSVVISFHPLFVTKIDRVYHVRCFYMEADKPLVQRVEVADLTTVLATRPVPMPVCRYEVLDGGPAGSPVVAAIVGQQVYHRFTCDAETEGLFCMTVRSCFTVPNANGDAADAHRVEVLDADGCSLSRYVLNNLEYNSDLQAGQEAHVFKFHDRPQLYFQCQIDIRLKERDVECARPKCIEPDNRIKREQRLRSADAHAQEADNESEDDATIASLDVTSGTVQVVDVFHVVETPPSPAAGARRTLCVNRSLLAALLLLCALAPLIGAAAVVACHARRTRRKLVINA